MPSLTDPCRTASATSYACYAPVGGLSLVNAIAGAYSEDLPIICIVGGPNSNDYVSRGSLTSPLVPKILSQVSKKRLDLAQSNCIVLTRLRCVNILLLTAYRGRIGFCIIQSAFLTSIK